MLNSGAKLENDFKTTLVKKFLCFQNLINDCKIVVKKKKSMIVKKNVLSVFLKQLVGSNIFGKMFLNVYVSTF